MRFKSIVAGAGLVLFAAIAWPLFARVENVVNVPLAAGYEASPMTIVRVFPDPGASAGTSRTHRTRLILKDPGRVLRHQRLGLLVGTRGTSPDLERAELSFEGTRCVYETIPGSSFPSNSLLYLVRADGCAPLDGTPTGILQLTVALRNQAHLVLWAHTAPAATVESETLVVDPSPDPMQPEALVLSGRLVDGGMPSDRPRRIELLAYMWQVASGSAWLWLAAALAAVAISAGFFGLWNPAPQGIHVRRALVLGFSAFLLTAGLGALYAVLTPPFQAPDEPHHFVAFAEVSGRPELVAQIEAWSALVHVTRIRFRPAEQFTPSDVGNPEELKEPWYLPASSIRGAGVHLLWRPVAPLLSAMSAPRVFLSLRLLHAVVLAMLVGCAVALIVGSGELPSPQLLAFPILVVPTLAFFGMHVSNHAPVIGAYVLLASGLGLIFLNRGGNYVSGVLVGTGWAMAIALSRSAMPMAPLIAAVAGARLVSGPAPARFLAATTFWAGLIMPVAIVLSMTDATYLTTNARIAGVMLPEVLLTPIETLTRSPWLLSFAVPALAVIEVALSQVRARAGNRLRSPMAVMARWVAGGGAGIVAVLLVGSLFVPYPVLETVHPLSRPPAVEYAKDALVAGLTILRFAQPDYRTSVTFWGGFGWLETLPSEAFVSLLTGATGLALIGLLIHVARTSDARRLVFLVAALAGFSASLAAYALSVVQVANTMSELKVELAIDLAGRYLFGLYLTMVVICWSGIGLITDGVSGQRWRSTVSIGCTVAVTGIHVYCLRLLLYRYF